MIIVIQMTAGWMGKVSFKMSRSSVTTPQIIMQLKIKKGRGEGDEEGRGREKGERGKKPQD